MNKRYGILFIGALLISSPLIFNSALGISDALAGVVVFILGLLWLKFTDVKWLIALAGIYLQLAPLIFWAKDPAAYVLDTMAGILCLIIALVSSSSKEEAIPPGWSYNPSSWNQRIIIIICASLCSIFARFLAAYQLGYVDWMWDPFFGDGTVKVITSDLSKSFPVSDAGMGAFAYTLDAILACHGGGKRWVESPWIVVIFALLVVPLGVVSLVLMILQPVIVHAWCTMCLGAVFVMLILVSFTIDELLPVLQLLNESRKQGTFWKTLWKGGDSKKYIGKPAVKSIFSGVSFSWTLAICVLIAVWLLATPQVFDIKGGLADAYHIVGAIALTISIVSMAEPIRILRYINFILGFSVIIFSWHSGFFLNGIISGLLLILFSIPRGRIVGSYGTFQRYIL